MCGIVGFINCGNRIELQQAVDVIQHRGPDNQSIKWFDSKGSGLGHARLSIIDLSEAGNQPMYDAQTGNWLTFNGEIYNYQEIRDELKKEGYVFTSASDTEVVLKAYHKWGEKSLHRFNGMFAFAIYNENSGDLFVCRDHLGIKPLYYYRNGSQIVFASEIKSILSFSGYNKEPDLYAIQTPVHFQVAPNTGFKDIYKLEAGHYFKLEGKNFSKKGYWEIKPSEDSISYEEAFEQLDYLLQDSIRLQMISDVPVGALLSGGLDSSIISALMQKNMNQPINTFTIKFNKEDLRKQGNVDDSHYAKKLAENLGFNHHEITIQPDIVNLLPKIIWHLDEPIADPAAINTYLISKAAKEKGIKVLLSGMGADEVFSGYRSHLACLKADIYQKVPSFIRTGIESAVKYIPESNKKRNFKYIRWAKHFLRIASLSQLDRALAIKNSALTPQNFNQYYLNAGDYRDSLYVKKDTANFMSLNGLSYLTKLCFNDSKIYLPDHNLAYSDKAIMAASVEGRPPLIDPRIVEFLFKLPPEFRINKGIQKYLLKKVSEKYLPREIIYRPKAPFSAPMRGWLKNELKEMVNDTLSFDTVKRRGVYNPTFVQKLIENNTKGLEDNSQLIWRLITNEIWFKTFFDN
ncbi:MAG: asparagine synthase (glutamine-hydrolyzing) [Bacteroidetes bacterium]|jgi:asparagine synthase (glutamine-hydrolysing)|nr:asparagine synthase (glutamine-hydrolyzing) [Bacteroidota bacterium]